MKRFYKLVSIVFVGLLIFASTSLAADDGIQISPLSYNFEINPGESQKASINITNLNDEAIDFVAEVEPFYGVSEDGAPDFSGEGLGEGVVDLVDWISFSDSSKQGSILAKEERKIDFTINVPQDAEPGGHYAAVFAKQVKKSAEGGTELGVASRVGTLILVSVPGDVVQSAKITSFEYPVFAWSGPIEFDLKVKNTGSVHFDSSSLVKMNSLLGKANEINMGTHTILPGSTRSFEGKTVGKYPFGYYSLVASATAGEGDVAQDSGYIVAIPLIIVLPALALLIAIILIVKYLRKHIRIV